VTISFSNRARIIRIRLRAKDQANRMPSLPALASSCAAVRSGKKVVTVYLPESVWRDAKMLAVRTDTTIDAIMRRGLDLVFAEHGINRGA
jgi:hypothetical protein